MQRDCSRNINEENITAVNMYYNLEWVEMIPLKKNVQLFQKNIPKTFLEG